MTWDRLFEGLPRRLGQSPTVCGVGWGRGMGVCGELATTSLDNMELMGPGVWGAWVPGLLPKGDP